MGNPCETVRHASSPRLFAVVDVRLQRVLCRGQTSATARGYAYAWRRRGGNPRVVPDTAEWPSSESLLSLADEAIVRS